MTALATLVLLAAGAAMLAASFFAAMAWRHAQEAADTLRDTKDAIAVWWSQAGPMADVMAERNAADMADALAERKRRSF